MNNEEIIFWVAKTKKELIRNIFNEIIGVKVTIITENVKGINADGKNFTWTGEIDEIRDTNEKGENKTSEFKIASNKYSMTKTYYENKTESLFIVLGECGITEGAGVGSSSPFGEAVCTIEITEINVANIYGFDENKNKVNLNERFNITLGKNDIAIVQGEINLDSGRGDTILSYPTGFNKGNCIVLSFMAHNKANSSSTGGYGYLEEALGSTGGAIGHMVMLRDNDINVRINNPAEHANGNASYDIKVVLLKIS